MKSNSISRIKVPAFANLNLYDSCYNVTVSLPVSAGVFDLMSGSCISYKGKYYAHWEKTFFYKTPFAEAFEEAKKAMRNLQVKIRQQKILLLENEIVSIERGGNYPYYEPYDPE